MLGFECNAAVACAAAVLLPALWIEPAALAAPAAGPPTTAGKGPPVAVAFSCPPRLTPRCAKGYRAQCIQWVYGGTKGPSMAKCCGRMGCVPSINPPPRQPPRLPKPLPGARVR